MDLRFAIGRLPIPMTVTKAPCLNSSRAGLLDLWVIRWIHAVNTVQEIEAAIRSLSPGERQKLAEDLPGLVPELDGDAAWERIIRDSSPRPAFSALVDRIEADLQRNPSAFPEIQESDFDRHS